MHNEKIQLVVLRALAAIGSQEDILVQVTRGAMHEVFIWPI